MKVLKTKGEDHGDHADPQIWRHYLVRHTVFAQLHEWYEKDGNVRVFIHDAAFLRSSEKEPYMYSYVLRDKIHSKRNSVLRFPACKREWRIALNDTSNPANDEADNMIWSEKCCVHKQQVKRHTQCPCTRAVDKKGGSFFLSSFLHAAAPSWVFAFDGIQLDQTRVRQKRRARLLGQRY